MDLTHLNDHQLNNLYREQCELDDVPAEDFLTTVKELVRRFGATAAHWRMYAIQCEILDKIREGKS
jgi:hypothetical protein